MSRDEQVRNKTRARHIVLSGKVQGVGFRPFIYRVPLGPGGALPAPSVVDIPVGTR